MIIKRRIGERGQVVIPKDIRQMLGVRSGQEIVFEIIENKIEIKPEEQAEEEAEKFVDDFFDTPKLKKKFTWKEIKKDLEERHGVH